MPPISCWAGILTIIQEALELLRAGGTACSNAVSHAARGVLDLTGPCRARVSGVAEGTTDGRGVRWRGDAGPIDAAVLVLGTTCTVGDRTRDTAERQIANRVRGRRPHVGAGHGAAAVVPERPTRRTTEPVGRALVRDARAKLPAGTVAVTVAEAPAHARSSRGWWQDAQVRASESSPAVVMPESGLAVRLPLAGPVHLDGASHRQTGAYVLVP